MKHFLLIAVCMLATTFLFAQQAAPTGKASVTIASDQKVFLENATVELVRSADTALVKSAITDKGGVAEFDNIPMGNYRVRASMVNYTSILSAPFTLTNDQEIFTVPTITLAPSAAVQMQGVTVTARKPFIQKLSDRIVVNVDNSIVNVGSSALDVLERSPGITVDQNDAISLRGRAGVIIMIDGKPTPMTGADLANYLRGLPSNAIERIDIITNPSAKYDAAGNSGIIDIHLKKDQRLGYNGTLNASYGQGVYPKANAGATFNYRNKKVNVFGNYTHAYREMMSHLVLDRNFYNNGVFTGQDLKDNYSKMPFSSNTARMGADFFPNKKTIIGFVVNSSFNHFQRSNTNNSVVINQQKQPDYTFKALTSSNDRFSNTVANLNFKHTFDSTGTELTADVDYGVFNNNSFSRTGTNYFNLDGSQKQPNYILDGYQDGRLTLKTAKADFVHPMKKCAKFEAGVKSSMVSSDNDAQFFDMSTGTPKNDENKTNRFLYDEYNNAGYVNYHKEYKKFNMQFGLRGEQTNVKGYQVVGDTTFKRNYFQLFPSAFLNYKVKDDQTIGLSVSRRIDRPGYSQLNPFLFLIDVTTYGTGNPALLPQLTWSYEASYTVKQLNFTLGYSHTKDVQNVAIMRFKDAFPNIPSADNVTIQIPVNLSTSDYVGLTVAAPVKIAKWWNMVNNANVYYNAFHANLGGNALNDGSVAADIKTNNTFNFKNGWTAELNANFNSGGRYGYMVSKPQWGLGTGVQKTVFKSKGTVKFNITDIFWTNLPHATITYQNKYIEYWHSSRDSRVATISFNYRFGNSKVAAARRRTTASEEERQRAGN